MNRLWTKIKGLFQVTRRACAPVDRFWDECEHDIRPTDDPDWGECVKCKDATFPLTERAAYGDVECTMCHDTGLVPDFDRPHIFADKRCPSCGGQDGVP